MSPVQLIKTNTLSFLRKPSKKKSTQRPLNQQRATRDGAERPDAELEPATMSADQEAKLAKTRKDLLALLCGGQGAPLRTICTGLPSTLDDPVRLPTDAKRAIIEALNTLFSIGVTRSDLEALAEFNPEAPIGGEDILYRLANVLLKYSEDAGNASHGPLPVPRSRTSTPSRSPAERVRSSRATYPTDAGSGTVSPQKTVTFSTPEKPRTRQDELQHQSMPPFVSDVRRKLDFAPVESPRPRGFAERLSLLSSGANFKIAAQMVQAMEESGPPDEGTRIALRSVLAACREEMEDAKLTAANLKSLVQFTLDTNPQADSVEIRHGAGQIEFSLLLLRMLAVEPKRVDESARPQELI